MNTHKMWLFITIGQINTWIEYLLKYHSTLAILYWIGLRVSEVVGDSGCRWKILSAKGKLLSRNLQLPEKWWKLPEEEGLWVWKSREPTKGILKEDIQLRNGIVYITSNPLKHGRRDSAIELSSSLPLVDYIIEAWNLAKSGDRVFKVRHSQLWDTLHKLMVVDMPEFKGLHQFRHNRAQKFANDEDATLRDMMAWFGWRRSATADSYITGARSTSKMRNILSKEVS